VSDEVGAFWSHHRLAWLRDPAHRFQSGLLAMDEGTELSLRVG
jgi:predicted phosphatase